MFAGILSRSQASIQTLKSHIFFSDNVRTLVGERAIQCHIQDKLCFDVGRIYGDAPDSVGWKIIDHCSAVVRLYAIFEDFLHEIFRGYLSFLEANFKYDELDDSVRKAHRKAIGQILVDLDKDRYRNLTLHSIVEDISSARTGDFRYRLLPEAMLSHDQNLRMQDLGQLCARCGVDNVLTWVAKHRLVKAFFLEQSRQSDTADAELRQLIQYRNDAAHGGVEVDDVLGAEVLGEYADFISVLCVCIAECLQRSVISKKEKTGNIQRLGRITEKLKDNVAIAIIGSSKIDVDDSVYLVGESFCFDARISSIQLDGVSHASVTILKDREVGLKFNREPLRGADIFKL